MFANVAVTYVYDDVTYVYDDMTYVYDDVTGYLFAMFANVAVNATPGRSSSMALLDAGDNLNPKPKP